MENKPTTELKVFISHQDSICGECGEQLGRKSLDYPLTVHRGL